MLSLILAASVAGSPSLEQVCGPATRVMWEQGSPESLAREYDARLERGLRLVAPDRRAWYRDQCVTYLIGAREALRELRVSGKR